MSVDIYPSGENQLTVGVNFTVTGPINFTDGSYKASIYGKVPG
jgi:hypothetical protein